MQPPVVLVSNSKRRQEIFAHLFSSFQIQSPSADEYEPHHVAPSNAIQFSLSNARVKAESILSTLVLPEAFVVGCDTIVVTPSRILGKPLHRQEAIAMWEEIAGETHRVISGVCAFHVKEKQIVDEIAFADTTYLTFAPLSLNDYLPYIDHYQPFDKAGAYGIQELPAHFIQSRQGSFWNVVGFPVERFCATVKKSWNLLCLEDFDADYTAG